MAKLADALDLGSNGKPYGFESLRPHQNAVFDGIHFATKLLESYAARDCAMANNRCKAALYELTTKLAKIKTIID